MSHVNRNDRLSRRLLGFTGKVQAVETQNAILLDRIEALERDRAGLIAARQEDAQRLSEAFDLIDGLASRVTAIERPVQPEPVPVPFTTDAPVPVTT